MPNRGGNLEGSSLDRYLSEIRAYPLLSREEEMELTAQIRAGCEESRGRLILSNLRFVVCVAKNFRNRGVGLGDLISAGNVGLVRAAHRFDGTRGVRFISYAVWWIHRAIVQALAEQGRIVRVPLKRASALDRVGRRSSTQQTGREPTVEEIADGLAVSREEVHYALAISQVHYSLDAPISSGADGQLVDQMLDQLSPGPDGEIFKRALAASIEEALGMLKEREAQVLRLYFGLQGGKDPMTLEEIGPLLGITPKRAGQIKEKALQRLRDPTRARRLETFIGHQGALARPRLRSGVPSQPSSLWLT